MNNLYNKKTNLIGEVAFKNFLELQATIGTVQRGGLYPKNASKEYLTRLVSDVNLLSAKEKRSIIFSEAIFNN
jgi:hypothetical protein